MRTDPDESPNAPATPGEKPRAAGDERIDAGVLRCVECGFDLSASPIGGRCPECGLHVMQSAVRLFRRNAPREPAISYSATAAVGAIFGLATLGLASLALLPAEIADTGLCLLPLTALGAGGAGIAAAVESRRTPLRWRGWLMIAVALIAPIAAIVTVSALVG